MQIQSKEVHNFQCLLLTHYKSASRINFTIKNLKILQIITFRWNPKMSPSFPKAPCIGLKIMILLPASFLQSFHLLIRVMTGMMQNNYFTLSLYFIRYSNEIYSHFPQKSSELLQDPKATNELISTSLNRPTDGSFAYRAEIIDTS